MPTHSEKRNLPYSAKQMYDLVADVGKYPEFLPWCSAARIRSREKYLDGPFKYLKSTWAFRDIEGGCEVDFYVDFEFKSKILQGVIGVVFNEAMQRIVRAFETRAAELYGGVT